MTTTAASRQALGPTARPLPPDCSPPSTGWSCSTATGAAPRASSTWCCATATCWSPARSRPAAVCGSPHEAVDHARLERLHRLVWRWAEEHDVRPDEVRVDLVAVLRPRRGARSSTTSRGWPDAVRHLSDGGVQRRGRPLVDVQADVSSGKVATVLVGRPDARSTRPATAAGWRSSTASRLALHPPHDDPPLPGRPAQARHPLRPGHRGRRARATGVVPPHAAGRPVHRRAHPGRRPAVRARRAADGDGRRRPRHPHVVVPEPQAREAAMVPGVEVLGMRSLAQVVAELRDEPVPDAPPVAEMSGQPAAVVAR